MFQRLLIPSSRSSFFLFGARGTGKSTFLKKQFLGKIKANKVLYFDLLDADLEERLIRKPHSLAEELEALNDKPEWVVLDEIQKVPKLLDEVHKLIELKKIKFILSGSSARKLKIAGANLLAGRAFEYRFFPLCSWELGKDFDLEGCLQWGSLPSIYQFKTDLDKRKYLQSYCQLYLKMEIQMEQLLRKLDPFRNFLEIAAQMNGKMINFTKIAQEIGVDTKTVQNYYQILEETWLGFFLPAFHQSLRKSQKLTPKFYLIDTGIRHALGQSLHTRPSPGTSFYGECFEHWVILEFYKLNHYLEANYRLSYFQTRDQVEIDLVLSRGKEVLLIEIKSSTQIDLQEIKTLKRYAKELEAKAYYLSQSKVIKKIDGVLCLPWQEGLKRIFQ